MTPLGGGAPAAAAPDADEEEEVFLLHSLADLEREHEAGDVDEADYVALRNGYTRRAAAVLRARDAALCSSAPAVETARRRRGGPRVSRIAAGVAVVVLVGSLLGLAVARYSAPRGTGDTVSGGTDDDRVAALLTDARSALGQSDFDVATTDYRAVLDVQADNVEARAYLGWVLTLAAQQLTGDARAATLAAGKEGLAAAIAIDPGYADPYCFLAIVAARFDDDVVTARSRRDECLAHDPSAEMQGLMQGEVDPVTDPPPASSGG